MQKSLNTISNIFSMSYLPVRLPRVFSDILKSSAFNSGFLSLFIFFKLLRHFFKATLCLVLVKTGSPKKTPLYLSLI